MPNAIQVNQTGGPDVLRWVPVDVADPGPGQVRLRHHAVGLNYIDVYHRTGLYPQPLPFIPGVEGAGVVEAIGDGVTNVAVGDRVAYAGPIGSYAELRLIDAVQLVTLPAAIDFDTAAGMMLQGLTVDMLINRVRPLSSGETILVHAAAGGVGLILCQWAKAIGATVIGTVSSDAKAELARAHGCDHPIVTSRDDFVTEVLRITDGRKLPVVYDSVGKDSFVRSLDCLARRGMLVSFGQASGPVTDFQPGLLAQKGSLYLTRPTLYDYIATRPELEASSAALFAMVSAGKVSIEIGQRFALADAASAHRALEARQTVGSTVLTV
ncbi:quinone oxidoreductase [Sphingomonas sp.]|uniref:quinone oxidoreductase family protein n=1 Tax=Sphingomonas sp. TaxID=28214 RepID=UPI00286C2509|nr:quinone oxidoreductase [Sphingomonas sp.]